MTLLGRVEPIVPRLMILPPLGNTPAKRCTRRTTESRVPLAPRRLAEVVHQDIESAGPIHDLLKDLVSPGIGRDIAPDGDSIDCLRTIGFIRTVKQDVCPFSNKRFSNHLARAAVAARHQNRFVCKLEIQGVPYTVTCL